jgi:hypothetical protein
VYRNLGLFVAFWYCGKRYPTHTTVSITLLSLIRYLYWRITVRSQCFSCLHLCFAYTQSLKSATITFTNRMSYVHFNSLFLHKTRDLSFTLVVDDFGIKYTNKDDVDHLIATVLDKYPLKVD